MVRLQPDIDSTLRSLPANNVQKTCSQNSPRTKIGRLKTLSRPISVRIERKKSSAQDSLCIFQQPGIRFTLFETVHFYAARQRSISRGFRKRACPVIFTKDQRLQFPAIRCTDTDWLTVIY
ncbi:MAG: hypothetical protein C5B58_08300 [Acidobacteria bacterium]|nr:MAG: hypothetical protein C5B58_08300 [Acidobacteriota bacterium]